MQQLTLQEQLYQEFYRAGNLLMAEIKKYPQGIWAKEYSAFMDVLDNLDQFMHASSQRGEKHGRCCHQLLCHFRGGFIRDSKKCKEDFPLLKQVVIMTYEIIGTNIDLSINIRNLNTGLIYSVNQEYTSSEKSLLSLSHSTIVMSHVELIENEVVIMKNFFYLTEAKGSDGYYWIRVGLSCVSDLMSGMYDLVNTYKQMHEYKGNSFITPDQDSINYLKRLKKSLEKIIGKKMRFAPIEEKLSEEELSFDDFMNFLQDEYLDKIIPPVLIEENFIGYRDAQYQARQEMKTGDFTRKAIILHAYNKTLDEANIGRISKTDPNEFQTRFQTWMHAPSHLFDNKTPTEFVQEKVPNFVSTDLVSTLRGSEEEVAFYGTYGGTLSDAENEAYQHFLVCQKKKDWKHALTHLEKLAEKHADFFRIRYNLLATKINILTDIYYLDSVTRDAGDVASDIIYLDRVDDEWGNIKKIAPYQYEAISPAHEITLKHEVKILKEMILNGTFTPENTKKNTVTAGKFKNPVYQLKIQLRHMRPSFYRTILIAPEETFFSLHSRIQDMFGLFDCHLWSFDWYDAQFGELHTCYQVNALFDQENRLNAHPAEKTPLSHFFEKHKKITYTYDFGDNWEFDVALEKVGTTNEQLPLVIRGKGGWIPEDIGGISGLMEYFDHFQDSTCPEYWEETEDFEMDRENDPSMSPHQSFWNYFEENISKAPNSDDFEWEDPKKLWKDYVKMRRG